MTKPIKLLPCPFCGSEEVEDDYDAVMTTYDGPSYKPTGWHEYQDGWINCKTCGASGPHVRAKDQQVDDVNIMVHNAWNTRK